MPIPGPGSVYLGIFAQITSSGVPFERAPHYRGGDKCQWPIAGARSYFAESGARPPSASSAQRRRSAPSRIGPCARGCVGRRLSPSRHRPPVLASPERHNAARRPAMARSANAHAERLPVGPDTPRPARTSLSPDTETPRSTQPGAIPVVRDFFAQVLPI